MKDSTSNNAFPKHDVATDQTALDDDEITVTSGTRTAENGPAEHEILVRFQLPVCLNANAAKQVQSSIICAIIHAYPNDVIYVDNRNEEIVAPDSPTEEALLQRIKGSSIQVHEVRNKKKESNEKRWISITKFRTTIPFRDWKKHEKIIQMLKKEKIFMIQHHFEKQDWDIISLGFLLGIHVVQFPKKAAINHLQELMVLSNPKPPKFDLHPTKVNVKGKLTYTRAYEVTCTRQDGPKLYNLMTHDKFREPANRVFVPYSLKRTNANTFTTLIKENNQLLSDSYVMKLHGLPMAAMEHIKREILQVSGVRFLVPTSKLDTHGEWRVLIKSSKFQGVNRIVRQNWEDWCKSIPQEMYENVGDTFPAPEITSKNVRSNDSQDDNSDDSYGTLLTTETMFTMGTLNDTDEYEACPLDDFVPSYAQAASGTPINPSPTSTITGSLPPAREYTTAQQYYENNWSEGDYHLHQKICKQEARIIELDKAKTLLDKRLEQILEEVQTKECRAKELENTVARLLEVVADRDQQMAERDQQFEKRNQQFDILMAKLSMHHTTESRPQDVNQQQLSTVHEVPNQNLRDNPSTPARSNKRQNTLATPNRANREGGRLSEIDADDIMTDLSERMDQNQEC